MSLGGKIVSAHGQSGVDLSLFPCLSASTSGHCSQVQFLLGFGAHKKGRDDDTFVLFSNHLGILNPPKHCKTREMQK